MYRSNRAQRKRQSTQVVGVAPIILPPGFKPPARAERAQPGAFVAQDAEWLRAFVQEKARQLMTEQKNSFFDRRDIPIAQSLGWQGPGVPTLGEIATGLAQSSVRPGPLAIEAARASAKQAGFLAADQLPPVPRMQYTPPPMPPAPTPLPFPAPPAPTADTSSLLLSGLAAAIDPAGGPGYASAALLGAQNAAEELYQHKLRQFAQALADQNRAYDIAREEREDAAQFGLRNAQAAHDAALLDWKTRAELLPQQAEASALLQALAPLVEQEKLALDAAAKLEALENLARQEENRDIKAAQNEQRLLNMLGAMAAAQEREDIQRQRNEIADARRLDQWELGQANLLLRRQMLELARTRLQWQREKEIDPLLQEGRRLRNELLKRELATGMTDTQKADVALTKQSLQLAEERLERAVRDFENFINDYAADRFTAMDQNQYEERLKTLKSYIETHSEAVRILSQKAKQLVHRTPDGLPNTPAATVVPMPPVPTPKLPPPRAVMPTPTPTTPPTTPAPPQPLAPGMYGPPNPAAKPGPKRADEAARNALPGATRQPSSPTLSATRPKSAPPAKLTDEEMKKITLGLSRQPTSTTLSPTRPGSAPTLKRAAPPAKLTIEEMKKISLGLTNQDVLRMLNKKPPMPALPLTPLPILPSAPTARPPAPKPKPTAPKKSYYQMTPEELKKAFSKLSDEELFRIMTTGR